MSGQDSIRRMLVARGSPEHVIQGGLAGLVSSWERAVEQVAEGYPLGLDDYLNDLDGRQLLEEALALVPADDRTEWDRRVKAADDRARTHMHAAGECLWGDAIAETENWTAERNWWYFSWPNNPGPQLREELEDDTT